MSKMKFMPEGWSEINLNSGLNLDNVQDYIDNNEILQGYVNKCDENFNLHVDLGNGIKGIIPRKEVEGINIGEEGLPKVNLCTGKVHKLIQFKITDVNKDNELQLSRKQVQQEAIKWVKNELKPGQMVKGIVKNIQNYGAFVEIGGGVVGLVHIEDLSVARIKSPSERLKIGQKIDIMVKSIDRNTGKVILSYKETLGTWEENSKKFEVGTRIKGIVRETEKNKNGIFVELTPNLVGMAEYKEGLEYGQEVDVYVKKIDTEKKKVKLLFV
ncbi:MAG: 30S ribosomal protein S1 [Clostridia bacterium]|nr:30S ribosomal protein S1 [Clostridia bacterium]